MGNRAADSWMKDSLVQVAFVTATIPLAVFYIVTTPENVFYQPLSPAGYVLGLLALFVPILMHRRERVQFGAGMLAGSMAVNTVFVFIVGPGNLWPLAIGLGTIAAAVPIVAGTLLGALGPVLSGRGRKAT